MATLRHEAKEVGDTFERKLSKVEEDAAVIDKVCVPISLALPPFPCRLVGLVFTSWLLLFLLQAAQEAQRAHDQAGQAEAAVQQMLSTLEELLRLMSRFWGATVGCGVETGPHWGLGWAAGWRRSV